ncbi:MAG: hypothetical protein Q9215_002289 [Flavoplaca cf. flavocitrina]
MTPLRTPRALVSAFSPDTPPETPGVADLSKDDAKPTYQSVTEQRLGSLDTKISEPLTPPNSRIPTPLDKFDKITHSASACLQDHSCWPPPTMTKLDPSTTWILQELEVLLADFPTLALRLNSPVIERLRAMTSGVSVADIPARQDFSRAPHSRFSPYRPTSPQSMLHGNRSPRASNPIPASQADTTAFALQNIFPQARPHHLESLQATYLAFQFIGNLPSSEFAMASTSGVAASPFASSIRHSRSSSLASNIPAKARAMLGLHSPVQSPASVPSPAVSWYRANSPELDSDVKMRLENVEILLERCVRRILIEIEGRRLGRADDALFRAVGEVIKMGERKTAAARWFGNNPTVVVKVGPKKIRFDVHKRQLCDLSPFFQAAFNGDFQENSGTMHLVEDDVQAFEHFVRWVYERRIDISLDIPSEMSSKDDKDDLLMARMRQMFDLYILADKYDVPILKDAIMVTLFDAVKEGTDEALHCLRIPTFGDIQHIYANTAQRSTLQKFVTACMTWFVDVKWYTKEFGSDWLRENPEIAADLAIGFARRLRGRRSPFSPGRDASAFLETVN